MALTKFGRETHKITTHNGQDSASAVRFATKRYTCRRDEDDSEDAFVGCICRGMTTSSRNQTVCAHANLPRRLFEGYVYFTQLLQLCGVYSRATSIRGQRLFAKKRYFPR